MRLFLDFLSFLNPGIANKSIKAVTKITAPFTSLKSFKNNKSVMMAEFSKLFLRDSLKIAAKSSFSLVKSTVKTIFSRGIKRSTEIKNSKVKIALDTIRDGSR